MTGAQNGDDSAVSRLRGDVEALARRPRHRTQAGTLPAARAFCARQLQQAGWPTWEESFTVPTRPRISDHGRPGSPLALRVESRLGGTNLLASRTGRQPAAGDTLLIAHLDTVSTSPGADDNASGVAAVLELARQIEGDRTTIALVDLEEVSMLGSRALARSLPPPGLVVCLDAIGRFSDRPRSQGLPAGLGVLAPKFAGQLRAGGQRGDFLLGVHRTDSAPFANAWASAASDVGLRTVLFRDPRGGRGQKATRWVNPLLLDLDRSDHAPFWWRRIPAVLITDTAVLRNRNYHRSTDTPTTLDYQRMLRLAQALTYALDAAQ